VHGRDDVGPGDVEQVRVALHVAVVPGEPLTTEVLLRQAPALQQHAPGSVEHHDALVQEALQSFAGVGHGHRAYPRGLCTPYPAVGEPL
jgi:hypothetical protein